MKFQSTQIRKAGAHPEMALVWQICTKTVLVERVTNNPVFKGIQFSSPQNFLDMLFQNLQNKNGPRSLLFLI